MRTTRVYVDLALESDRELALPAAASAHLLRVLRLRPGAALSVFNGRGGEYAAELLAAGAGRATVRIGAHRALERESALRLTLLQGIARGERMDLIVQKSTELGVTAIVPLCCEFSVVRPAAEAAARRRERWQAVAIGACEQCGRNRPPQVHPICEPETAFATLGAADAGLRLMLVPESGQALAGLATPGLRRAALLIGPEGGLSEREELQARRAGFQACALGPRILRTETAPLAAIAVLQLLAGDLGAGP
ncbi:MAG TPA: 16S rRNA (uracil(1498)-N(3))-methyltransferase [Steroidobacteraceae bacterium]|nr:16S rRNA (uracil(1498)-N(3))-methyltransferase [Steroidobacteraceae bacterium]